MLKTTSLALSLLMAGTTFATESYFEILGKLPENIRTRLQPKLQEAHVVPLEMVITGRFEKEAHVNSSPKSTWIDPKTVQDFLQVLHLSDEQHTQQQAKHAKRLTMTPIGGNWKFVLNSPLNSPTTELAQYSVFIFEEGKSEDNIYTIKAIKTNGEASDFAITALRLNISSPKATPITQSTLAQVSELSTSAANVPTERKVSSPMAIPPRTNTATSDTKEPSSPVSPRSASPTSASSSSRPSLERLKINEVLKEEGPSSPVSPRSASPSSTSSALSSSRQIDLEISGSSSSAPRPASEKSGLKKTNITKQRAESSSPTSPRNTSSSIFGRISEKIGSFSKKKDNKDASEKEKAQPTRAASSSSPQPYHADPNLKK